MTLQEEIFIYSEKPARITGKRGEGCCCNQAASIRLSSCRSENDWCCLFEHSTVALL